MQQLAATIVLLSGWRRLLLAMGAGAVAALAMPPLHVLPAYLVAFPLVIWLIDGTNDGPSRWSFATLRSAFTAGWGFGFGYFLMGFWWLGAAFLVEDDQFAWALPLGVLGVPAGLALFTALGFVLARLLWSDSARRILTLAGALSLVEWLRGFVLTGFPWNSFGQAFGATDTTAQIAALIGLPGLTILSILIGASPATLATGTTGRGRWMAPALGLVVLAGVVGYGYWRLPRTPTATVANVSLRIMQPNISQREKHRLSGQDVLSRYVRLTAGEPGSSRAFTHAIWPESPFPFLLAREPQALGQLSEMLRPDAVLITGAARAEGAGGDNARPRYFNAMHVVGSDGVIVDSYDKVHLVPFGEYLPFRDFFARIGLRQFVEVPGGFEAGARRQNLTVKGLPAAMPLICYEAIFPAEVNNSRSRPGVMINVTNDAWFGQTFGPHQHLAQARLRAVEQGLPLVRAANTGISAIIDPYGRIIARLALGQAGVLDGRLPVAIPPTIYTAIGNSAFFAILIACFLLGFPRANRHQ